MTFSCIFLRCERSETPLVKIQKARRRVTAATKAKTPTAITTDPSPSARAVAQATQITPRSPQITNKLLQITPESPQITPRSPQITSKAPPDHARDAEDHGQATPDHARVAADHSHTRAQATQATDDGRRRCAVGGSPRRHGPRARLHGRKGVHSTIGGFSMSPRLSMYWASTTLEGEPAATLTNDVRRQSTSKAAAVEEDAP